MMDAPHPMPAGMVHASLQRNVTTKAGPPRGIVRLDSVSVVSLYLPPLAISPKIALISRILPIPLLILTPHL